MGNFCPGDPHPTLQHLQQYQQHANNDQTIVKLLENIDLYPKDVPVRMFAKLAKKKPALSQPVKRTIQQQFNRKPLQKLTWKGVQLPLYFIGGIKVYYEGEWKKGQPEGYGKAYFHSGQYFQGGFVAGYPQCDDGLFVMNDGSFKRGNYKLGLLSGKGIYVSANRKFRYQGQWENDNPHGNGIQYYQDGAKYQGGFNNGIKQCEKGRYAWPNGKIYEGPFRQGFMNGYGIIKMPPNQKGTLQGNFQRNLIFGKGNMITQYGKYQGQDNKYKNSLKILFIQGFTFIVFSSVVC